MNTKLEFAMGRVWEVEEEGIGLTARERFFKKHFNDLFGVSKVCGICGDEMDYTNISKYGDICTDCEWDLRCERNK